MKEPTANQIYDEAIVIDALNVSNWESPAVYESLTASGVTAINATLVTWENFQQALDHIATWQDIFTTRSAQITQIKTVDDILQAKKEGKVGVILGGRTQPRLKTICGASNCFVIWVCSSCSSLFMSEILLAMDVWSEVTRD